jgi:predicted glycoside hydrolase/deacetylase ChbG (UPF0249 family)
MIVNADDLGISREVNSAIFDLMARNRLSSATLMANGPAVNDAITHLARFPECSFGIHLNLTQFEPLTAGATARLLVDSTGQLSRNIVRLKPSLALLAAAYQELCAQVERLRSLGVEISHFDSHNHVHTTPHFFPVLKTLQRRYRIRKVRLSKNLYSPGQPCSRKLHWQKVAFNFALRRIYPTKTTDIFTELLSFCTRRQEQLPFDSIELMTHPGASYAANEVALLQSDWLAEQRGTIRMINYGQLTG